jgi:putative glutamine amidotransferase
VSPARPVIGITASQHAARYGPWREELTLVPADYVRAVAAAGAIPIVLPAQSDAVSVLLDHVNGVLLTGGADVDPARYGAEVDPNTGAPDPNRDAFEMELVDAATAARLPVLAICRGIQVLNVARGGSLHQHLPDVVANETHAETPGVYGRHHVRIDPTSRLYSLMRSPESDVPTHHHQAVDRIGAGLVAAAWADDGTVEALEDPDADFLLAVQWHPEVGDDHSLFAALVGAASA